MSRRPYSEVLTFQQPVFATASTGQQTETYTPRFRRWTSVKELPNDESVNNGQKIQRHRFEIELRRDSELDQVTDNWRVIWQQDRTLNVRSTRIVGVGRFQTLVILAEEDR